MIAFLQKYDCKERSILSTMSDWINATFTQKYNKRMFSSFIHLLIDFKGNHGNLVKWNFVTSIRSDLKCNISEKFAVYRIITVHSYEWNEIFCWCNTNIFYIILRTINQLSSFQLLLSSLLHEWWLKKRRQKITKPFDAKNSMYEINIVH